MRTRGAAILAVVLGTSGCAVVGYPGGTPSAGATPAPVATGDRGGSTGGEARPVVRPVPEGRVQDSLSAEARGLSDDEIDRIPDAEPRNEARSAYGNPEEYEVDGVKYHVLDSAEGYDEEGTASWYGSGFQGRRTSSGEPYDMYQMTAAHPTLPIPTYVEVTNLDNGRKVVVRVNDRGPFHSDRIIDLSYVAARKLGMVAAGTAHVRVRALAPDGG